MAEYVASKTALGVAALRAAHQLVDGTPKILDDPVVVRLFDPPFDERLKSQSLHSPQVTRLRIHVLIRSRYAEDRLAKAVERGVGQYVILGAGYDTFAYRQPEWARRLAIFEVDQPATQADKRHRLTHAKISIPENVKFIPVDFETATLAEGLAHTDFDRRVPTFISWLGVMMYLTQDAIDAVLQFTTTLPLKSEIVFSFAQPENGRSADSSQPSLADMAAQAGEPWKTRLTSDEVGAMLRHWNFSEITIPSADELEDLYMRDRNDSLRGPIRAGVASAVV